MKTALYVLLFPFVLIILMFAIVWMLLVAVAFELFCWFTGRR